MDLGDDLRLLGHRKPRRLVLALAIINANADCLVAALYAVDKPVFILPLEVVHQRPGSHSHLRRRSTCQLQFPGDSRVAHEILPQRARQRYSMICMRPGRTSISCRCRDSWTNLMVHNQSPPSQLPHQGKRQCQPGDYARPEFRHACSAAITAKRKKKKHRQHTRRFEEAGGYRIVTATTVSETEAMLVQLLHLESGSTWPRPESRTPTSLLA